MAVRSNHSTSRDAVTRFEVLEDLKAALVKVYPKTGRTHQIRVHLAAIGCPVLADALYADGPRLSLNSLVDQKTVRDSQSSGGFMPNQSH